MVLELPIESEEKKKKRCETGLGKDWGHVLEGENLFWS